MNTGFARQGTVSPGAAWVDGKPASVGGRARVGRGGVRLARNGRIARAAPTPPSAPAVSSRKSRRVPPSWPVTCDCARSAIQNLVNQMLLAQRAVAAASYTVERAELCDRLPHKTAAKQPGYASL